MVLGGKPEMNLALCTHAGRGVGSVEAASARRNGCLKGELVDRARSLAAWRGHVGLAGNFLTQGTLR